MVATAPWNTGRMPTATWMDLVVKAVKKLKPTEVKVRQWTLW
jgi:hypothetical protein